MRLISCGAATPKCGLAVVLLLPMGELIMIPSTKIRLRADAPTPEVRVATGILGVAIMAFAHHQRGRVFQHILGVDGVDLLLRLGGGDLGVGRRWIAGARAVGADDDIFRLQAAADRLGVRGGGGAKRQQRCAKAQGYGHGISPKNADERVRRTSRRDLTDRLRRSGAVRGERQG